MDEIVWDISLGLSSPGEIVCDWSGVELCGVEGLFLGNCFVSDKTRGGIICMEIIWGGIVWGGVVWGGIVQGGVVRLKLFGLSQNSRVELLAWK